MPTPPPGARLILADWLDAAASLDPRSVDLLYVDPPFNTGRRQSGAAGGFDDSWPSTERFIHWLGLRLAATLPALRPSASLLIHIGWGASHRVRILLDELLGEDRFVNHLIWRYGLGGSSPRRFARKHDDILFYCLDPDLYWFDPPRVPATSRRMAGQSKKSTDILDIPASPSLCDAVLDIPSLNNMARERLGWPSQKPLALLELLVGACCPPGGLVLDPCMGSGTTLIAALRRGRRAVGFDTSPDALRLVEARLAREAPPACVSPVVTRASSPVSAADRA